ncbi:MAG: hypothetical protein ACP5GZ_04225 [Vulcanisaeta sp.]|uniref:hypothetical protein n=1 Tax=Vulcanisaeta sp. TaxID=2020871 RepID=UPI003D0E781C
MDQLKRRLCLRVLLSLGLSSSYAPPRNSESMALLQKLKNVKPTGGHCSGGVGNAKGQGT